MALVLPPCPYLDIYKIAGVGGTTSFIKGSRFNDENVLQLRFVRENGVIIPPPTDHCTAGLAMLCNHLPKEVVYCNVLEFMTIAVRDTYTQPVYCWDFH